MAVKSSSEIHMLSRVTMAVWRIKGVAECSQGHGISLYVGGPIASPSLRRSVGSLLVKAPGTFYRASLGVNTDEHYKKYRKYIKST